MATRRLYAAAVLLLLTASLHSEPWPGWRGPRRDGTSSETNVPIRWSSTDNVAWKVSIPGKGHSSPVIWDNRIFLTTCLEKEEKRMLLCLDRADGKILWQSEVLKAKLEQKHSLNSFASATPAIDGKHVWVTFLQDPRVQIACYDFDGNKIWQRSPGEFHSIQGFCSSPVLYKDLVIINGDQDAEAWIVALDKATGTERWRADRPNRIRSYCTPLIIDAAGKKQLVLSGSKCVASYDPDTGKQIWIVDGPTEQFVSSMVFTDNVLFLTAGFPTFHLMAIRPDGERNVTTTHVLWDDQRAADYVPSPIARGKYVFFVNDNGVAAGCIVARTGERMWTHRLGRHHSASPVSAAGYLYFPDDDGNTFVLKAERKFELVSRNALGEECYASPAISRGQIFIRTSQHLYCIGQLKKTDTGE
jgi:outer membrane protein assembly factor BamB